MNENKFTSIPANACLLSIGEFKLGDNGEQSKSAPVEMVIRSGNPIEHWYWGRVVHDLSGMRLHKSKVPIDYVHDDKEVLGFLNHFDSASGDMMAKGALVPFKDSDRTSEVMHKMREGVPYEASINFGGDGIRIEEVMEGISVMVNNRTFSGPGIVIREWPLRGVAICPYGADMNTESRVFSQAKTFSATVASAAAPETQPTEEKSKMDNVEAVAVEGAEAQAAVTEEKHAEDQSAEAKPVEAPTVEAEMKAEIPPVAEDPVVTQFSRDEFAKIVSEFGAEIAAKTVSENGNYQTALKLAFDKSQERVKALEAQAKEFTAGRNGKPVPVTAVTEKKSLLGLCANGARSKE